MAKPKQAELVEKIAQAKGNISAVARAYHVSRTAVYQWIQASPTCQQALKDQRESVVDDAESILYKMVIDKNFHAVAYTLNNSKEARERGWGVKVVDLNVKDLREMSDADLLNIIES